MSQVNRKYEAGGLQTQTDPRSVLLTLLLCVHQPSLIQLFIVSVNVVILVLLAVAFLIIVQRNLLNFSDFLHSEHPGMFAFVLGAVLNFLSDKLTKMKPWNS